MLSKRCYRVGGFTLLFLLLSACASTNQAKTAQIALPPETIRHQDYVHHQSTSLKSLEKLGLQVKQNDSQLFIKFPDDTRFTENSKQLNSKMMLQLNHVAEVLLGKPYSIAIIEGHGDGTGNKKSNQLIAVLREHEVIAYLEAQGIPANRLITKKHKALQLAGDRSVTIIIQKSNA